MKYIWILYEISKNGQEYLFGVFSSEELVMKIAKKEFHNEGSPDYRIERHKLDP